MPRVRSGLPAAQVWQLRAIVLGRLSEPPEDRVVLRGREGSIHQGSAQRRVPRPRRFHLIRGLGFALVHADIGGGRTHAGGVVEGFPDSHLFYRLAAAHTRDLLHQRDGVPMPQ
jgi:hypothetical protein